MKKMLLIGGIISIALPAMAAEPTNPVYYQPDKIKNAECGATSWGDSQGATEVTMVAHYAPVCGAGEYLSTANNQDGECVPCSGDGVYCEAMEQVELDGVTGLPVNNQGLKSCPAPYTAGTADENSTSIYSCQKKITSCGNANTGYASNFNATNGTITTVELNENGLFVNYRDVNNHCYDSLSCNTGYSKENVYKWIQENPQMATNWYGCELGASSCSMNLEPGTSKITIDSNFTARPVKELTFVSICSNSTADTLASNALAGNSTGVNCYAKNVDFKDQPWVKFYEFNTANACAQYCGMINKAYPFIEKNVDNRLLVTDASDNVYAIVNNKFVLQTENGGVYEDATSAEPLDSIGVYTYVPATQAANEIDYTSVLAMLKQAGQNDDSEYADADDNPVKVCIANKINITWNEVTLDENDPARTCTFGDILVTPAEPAQHPTDPEHYKFLGWKVTTE